MSESNITSSTNGNNDNSDPSSAAPSLRRSLDSPLPEIEAIKRRRRGSSSGSGSGFKTTSSSVSPRSGGPANDSGIVSPLLLEGESPGASVKVNTSELKIEVTTVEIVVDAAGSVSPAYSGHAAVPSPPAASPSSPLAEDVDSAELAKPGTGAEGEEEAEPATNEDGSAAVGADGERERKPRRKRLDKPHFTTRDPIHMQPHLVECFGRMQVKEDETIVTANYYPLSFLDGNQKPTRFATDLKFHRFDVEFQPFVPRIHRRFIVEEFNKQHFPQLSLGFDGNTLCFALAEPTDATELGQKEITIKPVEYTNVRIQQKVIINVQMRRTTVTGPVNAEDGTAFLQAINTCVKKALCKEFKLKLFKDVLWDLSSRDSIHCTDRQGTRQTYELVRGYDITVKPAQTGFYLTIDDTSRIFKQGTVFEWMNSTRKANPIEYKRMIEDRMRNTILYNIIGNELIRVAAVHFDKHPVNYKFKWRRGFGADAVEREVSIMEYYKERYGLNVTAKQPLIETVPPYKLKPNASAQEKAQWESRKNLIPADLCLFTGLDQSEKSNFQLMKQINERTKPLAMTKKLDLDKAISKYLLNENVQKQLSGMNIKLEVDPKSPYGLSVGLRARVILPPVMNVGGDQNGNNPKIIRPDIIAGKNGPIITFESHMRSYGAVIKHTESYVIALVTTERDENVLTTFYNDCIKKAAFGMKVDSYFSNPKTFYAKGPKTSDFSCAIEECCKFCSDKHKIPFVFVLVPDELKERYDQVKQVSLLNFGFLSQVMKMRTIQKPSLSVGTKVVMQVIAKMGSVKWALNPPSSQDLKSLMVSALIVGLDVHHDGERRGSVQACVGTLDPRAATFYQRSRLVARGEEISVQSSAYSEYIKDMISERASKHVRTEVIVIYRDGVSEGQLELALKFEYVTLAEALRLWAGTDGCPYTVEKVPKIIFVFVMKRHSTRFFQFNPDGDTSIGSAGYDRGAPAGGARGGFGGGSRGFGGGRSGGEPRKRFENPVPGTVVSKGIVRSDRAEFYLASHDTKEGCICPMRYEILRNETQPPVGMSQTDATAQGYRNVKQETIEDLTFYLTALYPNQCATIRLPVVCQLAQKFAMLSGQHLHQDAVDLQTHLRNKMFYL